MTTDTEKMSVNQRADELVKGKHSLVIKGIELACEFLVPLLEDVEDQRVQAALLALSTACRLRRARSRGRRS